MSQISLKHIAQRLNLSISTVSRALNDHPNIKYKTKKKVLAMAQELDYRVNVDAQNLQKKQTKIIGVIVPEIQHNFFSLVIKGAERVASNAGYNIIVCQSNELYEREVINTRALLSHRVAGVIVSISKKTRKYNHFHSFKKEHIPLVFFDRVVENMEANKVVFDDYGGAFQALKYLIRSGYKRIGHLAGPPHLSNYQDRRRGYVDAHTQKGLLVDDTLMAYGGLDEKEGFVGMTKLLALDKPLDAVFCDCDPVAFGAYTAVKRKGLRIPDDIAMVGFSNDPLTEIVSPKLTTVNQHADQIGEIAVNMVLNEIKADKENRIYMPMTRIITSELILREST